MAQNLYSARISLNKPSVRNLNQVNNLVAVGGVLVEAADCSMLSSVAVCATVARTTSARAIRELSYWACHSQKLNLLIAYLHFRYWSKKFP